MTTFFDADVAPSMFTEATGLNIEVEFQRISSGGDRYNLLGSDSGTFATIAREISHRTVFPAYIYVYQTGIWPSSENASLVRCVLNSFGQVGGIHEIPLIKVDNGDLDSLEALLGLALISYWDTILVDDSGRRRMLFTHDEDAYLLADECASETEKQTSFDAILSVILDRSPTRLAKQRS
jgi:hypothetical protein